MVSSSDPTVLVLTGIGVHPYSARGLQQTLAPIEEASQIFRTINGELIDFGYMPMQKYKSTITGNDQRAPVVDGVWPGTTVVVDCISTLTRVEGAPPARTVVAGSEVTEAGYVSYRPRLTMMVVGFDMQENEYDAGVGWKMELEEI